MRAIQKIKRPALLLLALFCLCLALATLLPPMASAAETHVYDMALLLSRAEQAALEARAAEISEEYGCGVYIVAVLDYRIYLDGAYGSIWKAAENIYEAGGFGVGPDKSGILLLLSMTGRDYDIDAYGYGNTAFTDYGKEILAEKFKDNFRRDDWYGGLTDYVDYCGKMLKRARDGSPLDVNSDFPRALVRTFREEFGVLGLVIAIAGVPLLVARVVCSRGKRNMKNVKLATEAEFFALPGSMALSGADDRFTHTTEVRERIESDSDRGGGGGGGTSVGDSGHSHSSGKF